MESNKRIKLDNKISVSRSENRSMASQRARSGTGTKLGSTRRVLNGKVTKPHDTKSMNGRGRRDDPTTGSFGGSQDETNDEKHDSEDTDTTETSSDKESEQATTKTFADLGIIESLCEACTSLGFQTPTAIQEKSIPIALEGRDIIGLAETGSGKTAAFALPMLQALLDKPQPMFGLVLAPTRELAYQISQQFEALGSLINVRCAVIVGGMDMVPQAIALAKKPHIVVATPGRLMDHLENTKGFSLRQLKYLVMDEADRLLDLDFGPILDKILQVLPRAERKTMLFSATMNTRLDNLTRAALQSPVRVNISSSAYQTVKGLKQRYIFIPHKYKDIYLVYILNAFAGQTCILFTRTVHETQRIAFLLRALGQSAIPLHGQMNQSSRLGALNKFKSGGRDILVATDVASRGLDIPSVDLVLNFDLPPDSKTYVHRVGRTARAGKAGTAISVVTQYDVEIFQRVEKALGKTLEEYGMEKEEVMVFANRVGDAQRIAINEMKALNDKAKSGKGMNKGIGGGRFKKRLGGGRRDGMDADEG